jgi:hypothetical protein
MALFIYKKNLLLAMLKKVNQKLTLISLLFSYILIMGHSFFPHHHYDGNLLINNSRFHITEDLHQCDNFKLSVVLNNYHHHCEKEEFVCNPFSQLIYSAKTKSTYFYSSYDKFLEMEKEYHKVIPELYKYQL